MHQSVLIVEDNHDLRVGQRQVLEERGFAVYSATNGKDALKLIHEGLKPKVIVLDLAMPLMNGEEFLKELNQVEGHEQSKVLIVSGCSSALEFHSNTCYMLYPKPIILDDFANTVRGLVVKRT